MKTRADVARFIEQTETSKCPAIPDYRLRQGLSSDGMREPWHYGLSDLRHLLDFIYGGPPQTDEENVRWLDRRRE